MFPNVELSRLNTMNADTMVAHLGIEFTKVGEDHLVARMPVDSRTVQPMRLLHGGASLALAETLGSVASVLLVDPSEYTAVGTEINASHVRSARSGYVTGTCRPIHIGRTSHIWEIRVEDERDKLVSLVRFTTRILEKRK